MNIIEEENRKEQLRAAVAGLPEAVVRDALVLSLSGVSSNADNAEQKNLETEGFKDIFELITYLKRTYTFPELDCFLIEGGKLLFRDGDRRIVISEKKYQAPVPPPRPVAGVTGEGRNADSNKHTGSETERFSRLEFDD